MFQLQRGTNARRDAQISEKRRRGAENKSTFWDSKEQCPTGEDKKDCENRFLKSSLFKRLSNFQSSSKRKPATKKQKLHVPSEIILIILSHLTHTGIDPVLKPTGFAGASCTRCTLGNLFSCSLISRAWSAPTNSILYSKLILDLDTTCEEHWHGDRYGDRGCEWTRRRDYLPRRYLQPLLRTLTENPDLGKRFKTVEIELHTHIPDDFEVLPLYRKILLLCPNLERINGDPCIFFRQFNVHDETRFTRRLANMASLGLAGRMSRRRVLNSQKKLWDVLAEHEAWDSWVWTGTQCNVQIHSLFPRQFELLHSRWSNLRHLGFKGFEYQLSFTVYVPNIVKMLVSLESLEIDKTEVSSILPAIPSNKLTTLIMRNHGPPYEFSHELQHLWLYLFRSALPSCQGKDQIYLDRLKKQERGLWTPSLSKLKKLVLEVPQGSLGTTKKVLDTLFTLAPNLEEVTLSNLWALDSQNHIRIRDDEDEEDVREAGMGYWPPVFSYLRDIKTAITPAATHRVRKLTLLFPGVSHGKFILGILKNPAYFPNLETFEALANSNVIEIHENEVVIEYDWYRIEGLRLDEELAACLEGRGLEWASDDVSSALDEGLGVCESCKVKRWERRDGQTPFF
ncbi:hypothetical protein RUND412_010472 [Rhizina undulata]